MDNIKSLLKIKDTYQYLPIDRKGFIWRQYQYMQPYHKVPIIEFDPNN